jgi:hypothetical protein
MRWGGGQSQMRAVCALFVSRSEGLRERGMAGGQGERSGGARAALGGVGSDKGESRRRGKVTPGGDWLIRGDLVDQEQRADLIAPARLHTLQRCLAGQQQGRQGIAVDGHVELAVVDAGAIGQQVEDSIAHGSRHVCFQPFGQGLAQFDIPPYRQNT